MLVVHALHHLVHMMMLEGPPWKGGLFLLNVAGVLLVSLCRSSWYFCLVLKLVHQSSVKLYPNNFLWLSEKMLAFSFNICLNLCSFIKALRTDKLLLYVISLNTCPSIIIDHLVSSLNSYKSILTLSVLHWVESSIFCQLFDKGSRTFNTFCSIFCKCLFFCIFKYFIFFQNPSQELIKRGRGGTLLGMELHFRILSSSSASEIKLWNCFKIYESISSERLHSYCDCELQFWNLFRVGN